MSSRTEQRDAGWGRRHFLEHLAWGGLAVGPGLAFLESLKLHAAEVRKNQKACILLWLGGGAPSIDLWDLKPGTKVAGEFKPIGTAGNFEISDQLPLLAKQADKFSLVRSMSTREADHNRGRYYLHTSYVPNPSVIHPTFGSIVSKELGETRKGLEIPAFVSVGGASEGAGFLGMTHAPFVVNSDGTIANASIAGIEKPRLAQRLAMMDVIETNFIRSKRGDSPQAHRDVYQKAVDLMTTEQMTAFKVGEEPAALREKYGSTNFGRGCLLARRLVEAGIPFVEVTMNGWDLHQNAFPQMRDRLLPELDKGFSSLLEDLASRGMSKDVLVVCMGEFGRTPRINQNSGRDHWASSWSIALAGGGLKSGIAIGETDDEGMSIKSGKSYLPGDVWATVAKQLGIPLDRKYVSTTGRPMHVTNSGSPIGELMG